MYNPRNRTSVYVRSSCSSKYVDCRGVVNLETLEHKIYDCSLQVKHKSEIIEFAILPSIFWSAS